MVIKFYFRSTLSRFLNPLLALSSWLAPEAGAVASAVREPLP